MKQIKTIESLNKEELESLIETIEDDLRTMPVDEINWNGSRDFYDAALRRARARLAELTKDEKSAS